ncbi:uncharacterized protein DDB_G0292186 [Musca vetustissima]|uniref:uncharacterized protein DDB_G0292186 n=1 Tax=Musca vetustissima TaxID=27455 RepID=UPI002AB6ED11|nr:uncharacterized protein DDB_G0292186 [Musca vetustissima]
MSGKSSTLDLKSNSGDSAQGDMGPKVSFLDWKMKKEKEAAANKPQENNKKINARTNKLSAPPPPPPLIASNLYNNNCGPNQRSNSSLWSFLENGSHNRNAANNNFGNSAMNFNGNNFGNNGYSSAMNFNGNNFGYNNNNNAMNFNGNNLGNNYNQINFNRGMANCNGPFNNNGMNLNGGNFNFSNGPQNNRNSFSGQQGYSNRSGGTNGFNSSKYKNSSDEFFKTDTLFRQKDMIEETIQMNPFRNNPRAKKLLEEFKQSVTQPTTSNKNKTKPAKKESEIKKSTTTSTTIPPATDSDKKLEPEVYVKNPRNEPNKPYIPLPRPPDLNTCTPQERKQMWKEYNQAIKPYKNREFYNAKRVVQRLGKKDPSELDEKDRLRLEAARERMAAHKKRLEEKYGKQSSSSTTSESWVLQGTADETSKYAPYVNYGNFGTFGDASSADPKTTPEPDNTWGRKILGGASKYGYFVSGGVMHSVQPSQTEHVTS